jgi:hypothetical protein
MLAALQKGLTEGFGQKMTGGRGALGQEVGRQVVQHHQYQQEVPARAGRGQGGDPHLAVLRSTQGRSMGQGIRARSSERMNP